MLKLHLTDLKNGLVKLYLKKQLKMYKPITKGFKKEYRTNYKI